MPKYRYKLVAGELNYGFIPIHDSDFGITEEKYGEEVFTRKRFNGKIRLIGEAATLIINADIETRFEIQAQKLTISEYTSEYAAAWVGEFWKTDCEIDEDKTQVLISSMEILDQYNKIVNGLNKEFNLYDLAVPTRTLQYNIPPILQFYRLGDTFITNFNNTTRWEQECDQITDEGDLETTYFFTKKLEFYYIPGDLADTIDVDITGLYERVSAGLYQHETEVYTMTFGGPGIKVSDLSGVLFSGAVTGSLSSMEPAGILDSATTASQVEAYYVKIFSRMLMPTNYLSACDTRPEADIIPYSTNYPFVYDVDLGLEPFKMSDEVTATATIYGRRDFPRLNIATDQEYYVKPTGLSEYFPICRTSWRAFSMWLYFEGQVKTAQEDGTLTVTIKDTYLLQDAIKYVLQALDENVTFIYTDTYSKFYFDENPLDESQNYYLLVPKTNLLVGDYDQPAKVVNVKLSELLGDLWRIHRVKWHINTDKEFYTEHNRFYRNGGNYVTPQIGVDISAYNEPTTDKPWGYEQNKYTYDKQKLPTQIVSKWLDKGAYPFDGSPININSRFVDESLIQEERMLSISTDIDYALLNVSEISKTGFFMVACSLASSVYTVKYKDILINGETFSLQNGWLSFVYLHDNFFTDDMPAGSINVNGADTTANSILRTKKQDVVFADEVDIDTMQLITTLLGTGQIESSKLTHEGTEKNITVLHDTE